jgi:hypothetical protein
MSDRATKLALVLLLLSLGTFQLVAVYPGYLSHDSAYQWWQARSGETTSLWPPGTIYLLAGFERVWIGPHALYALQIAAYWLCAILLVTQSSSRASALAAAISFALLPVAWICLPHVWIDVHMAVLLFVAVIAIHAATSATKKRSLLFVAMLFMVYASIVRHNAIVAIAPLVGWWVHVALSTPQSDSPRRFLSIRALATTTAVSLVVFAAIVLFYQLNVRLASKVRADTFAITLIWDLQAISVASGRNWVPPEISATTSVDDLRASYDPLNAVPMYINSKASWANSTIGLSQAQKAALFDSWRAAVLEHPIAYVKHRSRVLFRTIGIKRDAAIHGGSDDRQRLQFKDNPQYDMASPRLRQMLARWSDVLKGSVWATPLVWIVFSSAALLALTWRGVGVARGTHDARLRRCARERVIASAAIWFSGALYLASLWFTSPAADLRYALWPTIAILAATVYALDHTLKQ